MFIKNNVLKCKKLLKLLDIDSECTKDLMKDNVVKNTSGSWKKLDSKLVKTNKLNATSGKDVGHGKLTCKIIQTSNQGSENDLAIRKNYFTLGNSVANRNSFVNPSKPKVLLPSNPDAESVHVIRDSSVLTSDISQFSIDKSNGSMKMSNPRMHLLSDSHGRTLSQILGARLGKKFSASSDVKPNGPLEFVMDGTASILKKPSQQMTMLLFWQEQITFPIAVMASSTLAGA